MLAQLILPGLSLSKDAVEVLSTYIKDSSRLETLDISHAKLMPKEMVVLLKCLKENRKLRDLNLSMMPLSKEADVKPLAIFIRQNTNLLHINLSGLFQSAKQVCRIIKAVKKQRSILAMHLSDTNPIIIDYRLQAYIRAKLGIGRLNIN